MLGDELRKARQAREMTQEELGFKAGISRNYVSLLELNQKSPTVHTLMKICDVLGISAGKLLLKVESRRRR